MTKSSILAAMLVLALSAGPGLTQGTQRDGKLMSENAVRTASAQLYSDVLARACRNGWRYPRSQIENGFKRHLEELRSQLVVQGYTIVTDGAPGRCFADRLPCHYPSPRAGFGCSRPYWLDE